MPPASEPNPQQCHDLLEEDAENDAVGLSTSGAEHPGERIQHERSLNSDRLLISSSRAANEYRVEEKYVQLRVLRDMRARFWRARSVYESNVHGRVSRQRLLLSLATQEKSEFEASYKRAKRFYKAMDIPLGTCIWHLLCAHSDAIATVIPGLDVAPEDWEEDVSEPTPPNTDGLTALQSSYALWRQHIAWLSGGFQTTRMRTRTTEPSSRCAMAQTLT